MYSIVQIHNVHMELNDAQFSGLFMWWNLLLSVFWYQLLRFMLPCKTLWDGNNVIYFCFYIPITYLQISTTSTVLIFDHTITSTTKHYLQKYIFYCTSISILYIYFSILKSLLVDTQLSSCWRVFVYWSLHILVLTSLISLVQTYHCVGKS